VLAAICSAADTTALSSLHANPANAFQNFVRREAVGPSSSDPSDVDKASAVISTRGVRYVAPHSHELLKQSPADVDKQPAAASLVQATESDVAKVTSGTTQDQTPDAAKENPAYFGIGTATFLAALALMAFGLRKLNYQEEPEGMLAEGNPQDEDVPARDSREPVHPGENIPYRIQQVLVSWLFITASVVYFLYFLALQAGFDEIRHWFVVVALLFWLIGFVVQAHWTYTAAYSRTQMIALWWKIKACVVGQVHPIALIMGMKESDPEVWWPALAGVVFWHFGNMITSAGYYFDPPASSNNQEGMMSHKNLQTTEAWADQLATWALLISYVSITWWGGHVENQLADVRNPGVTFCQFSGVLCFLLASCIKCEWCNGFRNCRHRPETAA